MRVCSFGPEHKIFKRTLLCLLLCISLLIYILATDLSSLLQCTFWSDTSDQDKIVWPHWFLHSPSIIYKKERSLILSPTFHSHITASYIPSCYPYNLLSLFTWLYSHYGHKNFCSFSHRWSNIWSHPKSFSVKSSLFQKHNIKQYSACIPTTWLSGKRVQLLNSHHGTLESEAADPESWILNRV